MALGPVNCRRDWRRSAGRHAGALQGELGGLGVWWRGARFGLTEASGLESVPGPRMRRPVVQRGGAGVGEFYGVLMGSFWGLQERRRKEGT